MTSWAANSAPRHKVGNRKCQALKFSALDYALCECGVKTNLARICICLYKYLHCCVCVEEHDRQRGREKRRERDTEKEQTHRNVEQLSSALATNLCAPPEMFANCLSHCDSASILCKYLPSLPGLWFIL